LQAVAGGCGLAEPVAGKTDTDIQAGADDDTADEEVAPVDAGRG
jgi:hypothetical protein